MDIQRLRDIFDRENNFGIIVGSNYTIDEMGGALALYLTLTSMGKSASIISSKEPLVEVSNLVGIDRVRTAFEGSGGDLIVSFPYKGDEIGKVSYTLEAGLLNIIVKPKDNSLSFGEKDVLFRRSGGAPKVLVAVGVRRMSELTSMFNMNDLNGVTIVNIDKAGVNEGFGDIVVVGQGASTVSEQIANILLTLAYPLDPDVSQNLLSGIVAATNDFQSPSTSSLAFEMAGILIRNGAVRAAGASNQRPNYTQALNAFTDDVMPQPNAAQINPNPVNPVNPFQPAPVQDSLASLQRRVREFPKDVQSVGSAQAKDDAPPDWLAPKIYKGSTNVE
jgi:hypothetical protein